MSTGLDAEKSVKCCRSVLGSSKKAVIFLSIDHTSHFREPGSPAKQGGLRAIPLHMLQQEADTSLCV